VREHDETVFTVDDLDELSDLVARAWSSARERDWSARAGTLDWSCLATADHAVDCVYAPTFFLASRKQDDYPDMGGGLTFGARATPELLVESLRIATRLLVAVVNEAAPDTRAVIFRRPAVVIAPPRDLPPRGALELLLHAHDVCAGLAVPFEPPPGLCGRLREHTRRWPMWSTVWQGLGTSDDPFGDLLAASGRRHGR
jgi:hypothetical protein